MPWPRTGALSWVGDPAGPAVVHRNRSSARLRLLDSVSSILRLKVVAVHPDPCRRPCRCCPPPPRAPLDEAGLELARGVLARGCPWTTISRTRLSICARMVMRAPARSGAGRRRGTSRACGRRRRPAARRGRLLVPADRLEVVAHELLVEARLRPAGLIAVGRPEARRVGRQHLVDQRSSSLAAQPNSNLVSAMMMPLLSACRRRGDRSPASAPRARASVSAPTSSTAACR